MLSHFGMIDHGFRTTTLTKGIIMKFEVTTFRKNFDSEVKQFKIEKEAVAFYFAQKEKGYLVQIRRI